MRSIAEHRAGCNIADTGDGIESSVGRHGLGIRNGVSAIGEHIHAAVVQEEREAVVLTFLEGLTSARVAILLRLVHFLFRVLFRPRIFIEIDTELERTHHIKPVVVDRESLTFETIVTHLVRRDVLQRVDDIIIGGGDSQIGIRPSEVIKRQHAYLRTDEEEEPIEQTTEINRRITHAVGRRLTEIGEIIMIGHRRVLIDSHIIIGRLEAIGIERIVDAETGAEEEVLVLELIEEGSACSTSIGRRSIVVQRVEIGSEEEMAEPALNTETEIAVTAVVLLRESRGPRRTEPKEKDRYA